MSRLIGVAAAVVVAGMLMPPLTAQAPARAPSYQPPRTAAGHPDLQGVWRAWNLARYDLEDHGARPGIPAGRGFVVDPPDGKIPYQPWALEKRRQNVAATKTLDPDKHPDPVAKCFMPGIPRYAYLGWPFQIVQTGGYVAFYYEWMHQRRFVPVNSKTPVPSPDEVSNWLGVARGRFDGNTLVVDVTNFNGHTWLDMSGNFHSDALRVTERYTPINADTLQYEATMEDPKVYTRPWTIRMLLQRQQEVGLLDYECQAMLDELGVPHTWPREFEVSGPESSR